MDNQKSLAQRIFDSTEPGMFPGNSLTQEDQKWVRAVVEKEVEAHYKGELKPDDDRSQFEFPKGFLDGISGEAIVERFRDKPLKQRAAISMAKELAKAWEGYIRRSPVLKLVESSAREFSKEVRKRSSSSTAAATSTGALVQ